MKQTRIGVTLVGAAALLAAPLSIAQSSQSEEIQALKAQLQAIQEKLEQLEKQQQEQQIAQDRATDAIAQTRTGIGDWVSRFQWKGDFRYRNETIDQEFVSDDRNRDRIRVRAGFAAKVNDTVRVEVQAATTENFDSRSSNQTLTNTNSRKALDLDMAYAEWSPNEHWRASFGKMRYPWSRTNSSFFDSDINPEGVGINWQQGQTGFFASAFYTYLVERSSAAESTMSGAQFGWKGDVADSTRLTLAASYFGHGAVEGYNVFLNDNAGNAFGNTVSTDPAVCRAGIATCIANDFNIAELQAELSLRLAGRPLTLFADYAQNQADVSSGLDTAYAVGFQYGRVSGPRTWEFAYSYQQIEKDALFGQWIDSDYGGGNTDSKGSTIRVGYGFAKNFRFNGTYFLNKTNIDVPTNVSGVGPVTDRDYKRLQLDLNMSF